LPENEIRILGLAGLGEVAAGDDLGAMLAGALAGLGSAVREGSVLVLTQKIVSKSEGRMVQLDSVRPSALARSWGERWGKDPRLVELVLGESRRIVRMERGVLIAETAQGFVCANAGVDVSNCPPGTATLLPLDPDDSARCLRAHLEKALGVTLGVLISDSFGRPWREGQANCALGVAGLAPLIDYRGQTDTFDRELQATAIAVADELAAAAELVMGKTRRIPAALIAGFETAGKEGSGRDLIRAPHLDLFR
jgi:coenzyme F420-0:L-glutamate ligase / coenzyme F420-1:gamma-L-glutamate ligase